MAKFGGISGDQLRQYIERIERLEEEKRDIADNIKDAYAESKSNGFDPKILRKLVSLRKMEESDRNEQEEILDLYKAALGMIPEFESRDDSDVGGGVESVANLQNEVESPAEVIEEETAA
jgi:uncharacterized protein (UPF0335 family)